MGDGTADSSISGANQRFLYSATVSSNEKVLHLKLVNASSIDQPLSLRLTGISGARTATVISLHGATFEATNTINDSEAIHPIESMVSISDSHWTHTVPPLSIEVIDVPF
jgi:alpha-L-arabinofuranosidase